ncbi:transposase [Kitasatospora sp. NPDC056273]|uniref:transposase n=1 Tax=Kitasatospora sp. NPDC056273 TaxID=3345769 RepID=UPI0035DDB723
MFVELSLFREDYYASLSARADAFFEPTDTLLCSDAPTRTPVELSLTAEHHRGYGSLYGALDHGRLDTELLRDLLAELPLPRFAGRIVLTVDVSPWLRSDAACSPERLFCLVHGRAGQASNHVVPGWPYSFVTALTPDRTSWTQVLDVVRLGPSDDAALVTAAQLRQVVRRLVAAGQWRDGDPDIVIVMDTGYDPMRLAYVLRDLPVEVVGRLRSDRVLRLAKPAYVYDPKGGAPEARAPLPTRRPRRLARTHADHQERHPALRQGRDDGVGPGPPLPHPPLRLDRRRRRTPAGRGHPDPAEGRPLARRPRRATGLAVVLQDGRHRR